MAEAGERGAERPRRLFFALWPPDPVAERLERAAIAAQRHCGGRRMRRETLHLTLAFLGEVMPARIPELERIARAARVPRFLLRLDQVGYWRHNRLLWAGTREMPPELGDLVLALGKGLLAAGFRVERRPFAVHLTLLRNAREAPRPGTEFEAIGWEVPAFRLVESQLEPDGARYAPLGEWDLL